MAQRVEGQVFVENAKIIMPFRNFSGKEDDFNKAGNRNFAIELPHDLAEQLLAAGWNVKTLKPREEGDTPTPYIQINVGYKIAPPMIVMITSKNRTYLGEDEVAMLDVADIKQVDLSFTPYNWSNNAGSGVKAYLKKMFVTIEEDLLDLKYADILAPSHKEANDF